jgi:hypothetical protein
MEAMRSSETLVLTRATRRNIPEDGILDSHRRELSWPTGDKIDDVKDGFYKEQERLFNKLPKYHMKILLETSLPK